MRGRIGVVGGGAADVLAALGLIEAAGGQASSYEILIIDPRSTLGQGTAYSTAQARHLLNVAAGRMGALPRAGNNFVSWLRSHGHPEVGPDDFVARAWFGDYLTATLKDRVHASGVTLTHLRDRVVGLAPTAAGIALTLDSQSVHTVDVVVLALGHLGPRIDWAPAALRRSERFVPDPWAPQALTRLEAADTILLVGTGLTMVDVARVLAGRGRTLTAISRSGRLPHAHRAEPAPPIPAPRHLTRCSDLMALRDGVDTHLQRSNDRYGDWRPAFDGLRPVTAELWGRLTDEERERAVRDMSSWWNRHRHRMAPQVSKDVERLTAKGQLHIGPGEVRRASATDVGFRVELNDGSVMSVDAVVNCTGQETHLHRVSDYLIASLSESGTARPGPVGIGLDTTGDGQILDRDGGIVPGLYALGAMRVGTLWESTAIPEIRDQACAVGHAVLDRLASARGRAQQGETPFTPSARLAA